MITVRPEVNCEVMQSRRYSKYDLAAYDVPTQTWK